MGAQPVPTSARKTKSISVDEDEHRVLDFNRGPFWVVVKEVGFGEAVRRKSLFWARHNWGILLFLVLGVIAFILLGLLAFEPLDWHGWFVPTVLLLLLVALVQGSIPTHVCMLAAVTSIMVVKAIDPEDGLTGFGNKGVAAVAVLFIVAEGIQRTSVLQPVFRFVLGKPKRLWVAQLWLLVPVAIISAFLNNTPIVAMMIPVIQKWARRAGFSASKLLMPMNNATLLGGTVTILGTSTNLVVVALASQTCKEDSTQCLNFPIFGVTKVGFPLLVIGLIYMLLASNYLIKDRTENVASLIKNPREYTVALLVQERSPIVGETIQEAGLRQLTGLFLVEITREDGEVVPAVSPETRIFGGDILLFAGVVETVTELYLIPGLVPATAQTDKIKLERHRRILVEVVISPSSRLHGLSVKESKFRSKFDAAIIAVHRGGEHVREKIGDIILRGGDTLLIETGDRFVPRYSKDPNFALVAVVAGSQPPREDVPHMVISVCIAVAMIAVAKSEVLELLPAAGVASFL